LKDLYSFQGRTARDVGKGGGNRSVSLWEEEPREGEKMPQAVRTGRKPPPREKDVERANAENPKNAHGLYQTTGVPS